MCCCGCGCGGRVRGTRDDDRVLGVRDDERVLGARDERRQPNYWRGSVWYDVEARYYGPYFDPDPRRVESAYDEDDRERRCRRCCNRCCNR